MGRKPLIILTFLFAAYSVRAQHAAPAKDTVLKGSTIEVLQSYKPQVKQAPKPEWIPQLPPADTTHPTFNYDVPQQTLYYTYSSLPLRPLALGKETIKLPFANYVKLGGGNLSTLFLDAGISGISGKEYELNVHFHFLSQMGNIKYQQSTISGTEAEGLIHKPKTDWHIVGMGERNQYYYYGYNHDLYNFNSDSVKQTYTTMRVGVDMKNTGNSNSKLSYNPAINASIYTAAFNALETNIGFNLPFEYKFDTTVQALLAINGDFAHLSASLSGDKISKDNTLTEILPGVRIHTGPFTGHAIVGFAFGINGNNFVLPDIRGTVKIPGSNTMVSAGYQSSLRQNTYEQLSTENPYMSIVYEPMQAKRDEVYAAIQGGTGDHFSYLARVSWWNFTALPTFLNDFGDNKQFRIEYDNVQAISLQLSARYKVANKWSAGVSGDFYNFNNGILEHVWHEPAVKIKGEFTAEPLPKLTVTAYLALLGGIYALDNNHNSILLNPIFDIGGNAEYQIIPRLSAFIQINNLLNNTYQRWYGYQAYGINIYGGLRLKF